MERDDRTVFPNEHVARAIDTLATCISSDVTAELLVLSADTIRVAVTGRGRAADVTLRSGTAHCDVTVYSFAPGHSDIPDSSHHHEVAVADLAALLAQPLRNRAGSLFTLVRPR